MKNYARLAPGILFCLVVAVAAWIAGQLCNIVGGPVFAILFGMAISMLMKDKKRLHAGIGFTSKKVLQYAVILLGFGMNLFVVLETGKRSLPIIISTILSSLIVSFILQKALHIHKKTAILVGVGSSICGGSAIAATAPVVDADDDEVAQAISVIFFFNILAALLFPAFGTFLGFDTTGGEAFGIFAGTAVNDTSSVTATASTWDTIYHLGSATLDTAVTVKLTRTLAIIPITLILALYRAHMEKSEAGAGERVKLRKVFPFFIIWFIVASLITTVTSACGIPVAIYDPIKTLSKFLIVMAMAAIGMNTNIAKLVKTGGKPLLLGLCCWVVIISVSLVFQKTMGIW